MAKSVEVKLNREGVAALMKSSEMQSTLQNIAKDVASRCGDGYQSDVFVGKNRANASVMARTAAAKRDNIKNNTILKSLKG